MSQQKKQLFVTTIWIIIGVITVFFVYLDQQSTKNQKKKKEQAKVLFQLNPTLDPTKKEAREQLISGISDVTIYNGNRPKKEQSIKLVRKGKKAWFVTKPVQTPADEQEVGYLLRDLLKAKQEQVVSTWKSEKEKPEKDTIHW